MWTFVEHGLSRSLKAGVGVVLVLGALNSSGALIVNSNSLFFFWILSKSVLEFSASIVTTAHKMRATSTRLKNLPAKAGNIREAA